MMFAGIDSNPVETGPFTQMPQCISLDIGQWETMSTLSFAIPKASQSFSRSVPLGHIDDRCALFIFYGVPLSYIGLNHLELHAVAIWRQHPDFKIFKCVFKIGIITLNEPNLSKSVRSKNPLWQVLLVPKWMRNDRNAGGSWWPFLMIDTFWVRWP